jgi:hypothetical protein
MSAAFDAFVAPMKKVYETVEAERDALKAECDAFKAERDAFKAERDALKEKLRACKAELREVKEEQEALAHDAGKYREQKHKRKMIAAEKKEGLVLKRARDAGIHLEAINGINYVVTTNRNVYKYDSEANAGMGKRGIFVGRLQGTRGYYSIDEDGEEA